MVHGRPINMPGFEGTDTTTDPYILGKQSTTKNSLGYNFRAKNNVRVSRGGYPPVLDKSQSVWFPKSGVYFPRGARAVLPHTQVAFDKTSFYLGSDSADYGNQTDFTISCLIKFSWKPYTRTICKIPVDFTDDGATYSSHMHVELYPGLDDAVGLKRTYVRLTMMLETGGNVDRMRWVTAGPYSGKVDFQDDTWTHIAITRGTGNGTLAQPRLFGPDYSTPDMFTEYTMSDPDSVGFDVNPIADTSSFATLQDAPLMYNHLEIGDTELSIAEFRIWNKELLQDGSTNTEIEDIAYEELVGTETGLVCYCPFNEGGGKYFEDKANQYTAADTINIRGYFTPNEPWVDEDYRLIFTGYDCMAYPSLRSRIPDLPSGIHANTDKLPENATYHQDQCEDGAYDGGILWDTQINLDDKSSWNFETEGVYYGSCQIKFILRQLKEGIICGRLGLLLDADGEAYRFFFIADDGNTTDTIVYTSEAIVNATWLGVEKRITIIYEGDSQSILGITGGNFEIYVDSEVANRVENDTAWTDEAVWSNGDYVYGDHIPYNNTTGTNNTDGAIGGSPRQPDMCIAFDLLYFRQWWGPPPQGAGDTIADTLAVTDVDNLTEVSKYLFKDIHGYIEHESDSIICEVDGNFDYPPNLGAGDSMIVYAYVRMPLSDEFAFDMDGGDSYVYIEDGTSILKKVFKQDTLVRRVLDWEGPTTTLTNSCQVVRSASPYCLTGNLYDKKYFNGAIFSNLVNEYGPEQFKNSLIERLVFTSDSENPDGTETVITTGKLFLTVEDGSPLQGTDKVAGLTYKSRYLILGIDDRESSIRGMRSLQPRWCTAPLTLEPTTSPAVRGICRYVSENEDIDKLVAVAWNGLWEVDASDGTLTALDFGWMDRNSDEPVNFALVNNTLVVMDSKSAIKMNYKGKVSRLGIERPADLEYSYDVDTTEGMFDKTQQYAYTAQFCDTENNSYSGTLPVFSDQKQTIRVGDLDADQILYGDIEVRACKDPNVDKVLIFRTLNLGTGGGGSETELFKICDTSNNKDFFDSVVHRDVWADTELPTQSKFLPSPYYGDNLVAPPCRAIGAGLGRLWVGNSDDATSSIFWSSASAIGFPKPDHFPSIQELIVEEGGTSKVTALVEFSESLFVFKSTAMFIVSEKSPGEFGVALIYKGVGAVNQRCALVAGDALLFLDSNGLYAFRSGEPQIATPGMVDWFRDEVNQDNIATKAFMLHYKKEDQVLVFVPSAGSSYCDRCLVLDLRTSNTVIDLVPQVTCGYVDNRDDVLYLGTPYGQILKYDPETFVDVLEAEYFGTATLA